ncbi:MAG: hypothetical protein KAJ53_11855, partial [Anaerolineales bacterium]|nr:hypothetical protein [Anaerolineales bacterium]
SEGLTSVYWDYPRDSKFGYTIFPIGGLAWTEQFPVTFWCYPGHPGFSNRLGVVESQNKKD